MYYTMNIYSVTIRQHKWSILGQKIVVFSSFFRTVTDNIMLNLTYDILRQRVNLKNDHEIPGMCTYFLLYHVQ